MGSPEHQTSEHHSKDTPIGLGDVIGGAIGFLILCFLMNLLFSSAVPGLLKPATLFQVVLSGLMFLAVWGLFGRNAFAEYFEALELREAKTLGAEALATESLREAKRLTHEIEEELKETRVAGIRARDALIEEAAGTVEKLTSEASSKAEQRVLDAQEELARLREKAQAELEQEASSLAKLVEKQALGLDSSATIH